MFYRSGFGVSPILTLLDRLDGKTPTSSSINSHGQRTTTAHATGFYNSNNENSTTSNSSLSSDGLSSSSPPPSSSTSAATHPLTLPPPLPKFQRTDPPTIFEFLDEDDLLQECRANNPRLVRYLCRDENIKVLIAFATTGMPPLDMCIEDIENLGGVREERKKRKKRRGRKGKMEDEKGKEEVGKEKRSQGLLNGNGQPNVERKEQTNKTNMDKKELEKVKKIKKTEVGNEQQLEKEQSGNDVTSETGEVSRNSKGDGKSDGASSKRPATPIPDDVETCVSSDSDSADSSPDDHPSRFYAPDFHAKMRLKYPYVCAEVLSAEVAPLMDKILNSDKYSDLLFAYLDECDAGDLDPTLATHFVKIMISLLKTRNTETLRQMARKETLIPSMLKHLNLDPVTELFVRILDPPGSDRPFQTSITPPSQSALDLLAKHKILSGLTDVFIKSLSFSSFEERKRCEDVMSNAITAIHDITQRILQLPHLSMEIPGQLSLYSTPEVVARLLDAGLEQLKENISPFLLALKLSSNILTTDANMKQEYDVLNPPRPVINPAILGRGRRPPLGPGIGPPLYGGPAAPPGRRRFSFHSPYHGSHLEEVKEEEEEVRTRSPVDSLPVGSTIVPTNDLEELLRPRFAVLADMLGETNNASGPLGSVRLNIAEFFAACLKVGNSETVKAVSNIKVPEKLLELFLTYKWSSMLHSVVASSIKTSLEQADTVRGSQAAEAWISAGVIPWLSKVWNEDDKDGDDPGNVAPRCGYRGHLIQIGSGLQTFMEKHMSLDSDQTAGDSEETETSKVTSPNLKELSERYGIDEQTAEEFYKFCTESLAPARQVELTPLCDGDPRPGSDFDESFEEPTEVFDMSDVIDGLTQSNDAIERFTRQLLRITGDGMIEEEEEVSVVDTDLSHFQEDDGDDSDDDEDVERKWIMNRQRGGLGEDASRNSEARQTAESPMPSTPKFLNNIDEQGAIATIESSDDEEEGTYEEFVADKYSENSLSAKFKGSAKVTGGKPQGSPSKIDVNDAVTEIEDSTLEGESSRQISLDRPGSARIITEIDDDDLSSDEDDEGWVEFSEVEESGLPAEGKAISEGAAGSTSVAGSSAVARSGTAVEEGDVLDIVKSVADVSTAGPDIAEVAPEGVNVIDSNVAESDSADTNAGSSRVESESAANSKANQSGDSSAETPKS